MSWNDPGSGNRDPWGGRRDEPGPPDLDELVRKLKERFKRFFRKGDGDKGDGDNGRERPSSSGSGMIGIAVVVVIGVIAYLASGFYIVDQGWRGVETRFGQYTMTTLPGAHWHLPYPIEQVIPVNVDARRRIAVGYEVISPGNTRLVSSEALMLTKDANIVSVQLAVQYHVRDPAKYVFNFRNPDQTLKSVAASALRQVVGKRKMDFVLTRGRAEVANQTRKVIEEILSRYELGLQVVTVAVQDIQPPEPVQSAFADVNMAREDKQRLINQAQGYRNSVIPKAQGQAARIAEQAQGYRAATIAQAEGETSRFRQIASEYVKAPEIMRERLYLETMEEVLSKSGKVVVSNEGGAQPFMYLPLDRMLERARRPENGSEASVPKKATAPAVSSAESDSLIYSQRSSRARAREVR